MCAGTTTGVLDRAAKPPSSHAGRAASCTTDSTACHEEREEMSQHDFEPDATKFTAAPEFTEADFSTPGHDTWTSTEHPGHADPHGPGAWSSPQEYGQPEDMNGQGVFVPAHDDPWETEPTPPTG